MSLPASEQAIHDKINLSRLVKRLQKSVAEDDWDDTRRNPWIKALGTLQTIKYAKKLLKNTELDSDGSPQSTKRIHDMRTAIERVETFVLEVEKRTAPKPSRPEPLLPHIPPPQQPTPTTNPESPTASPPPLTEGALLPVEEQQPFLPTSDLLLSPSDTAVLSNPVPESPPRYSSTPSTALLLPTSPLPRKDFQNTTALHEDLASQLSLMATQLKRNAQHFSSSLSKDQAVVDEAKEKLEANYDVMHREQVRLKEHRKGSWWTTGLSIGSLVGVFGVFMIMFFIIRIT